MLLTVEDFGSHVSSDMVWDIISENEGYSLTFFQMDMCNNAFTEQVGSLLLPEGNSWAGFSIFLAVVDRDIQLKLDVFA